MNIARNFYRHNHATLQELCDWDLDYEETKGFLWDANLHPIFIKNMHRLSNKSSIRFKNYRIPITNVIIAIQYCAQL